MNIGKAREEEKKNKGECMESRDAGRSKMVAPGSSSETRAGGDS